MLFLFNTCEHPDVLRVLYFLYLLLDIVFIVVPIGLIVMLMIDFSKAVISTKTDDMVKSTKLVSRRILYAVIVFIIPWIVNVFTISIEALDIDMGGTYKLCLTNVNDIRSGIKTFEYFDKKYEFAVGEYDMVSKPGTSVSSGLKSESKYGDAAAEMLNLARGEICETDGTKYGLSNEKCERNVIKYVASSKDEAWCAYFANYIMKNVDIISYGAISSVEHKSLLEYILDDKKLTDTRCDGACAGSLMFLFDTKSYLSFEYSYHYGGDYIPKKGDIIFFWDPKTYIHNGKYWDKSISSGTTASHIGFVDYVKDGKVITIEGNYNSKVSEVSRSLFDEQIMGYGIWYK